MDARTEKITDFILNNAHGLYAAELSNEVLDA